MKFFANSTKIAGALAAALMVSAPLALIPTASSAATVTHGNDRHDGYRGARNANAADHGYRDRDYRDRFHRPGMERVVFQPHGHMSVQAGHWGYAHGQRMWIALYNVR